MAANPARTDKAALERYLSLPQGKTMFIGDTEFITAHSFDGSGIEHILI